MGFRVVWNMHDWHGRASCMAPERDAKNEAKRKGAKTLDSTVDPNVQMMTHFIRNAFQSCPNRLKIKCVLVLFFVQSIVMLYIVPVLTELLSLGKIIASRVVGCRTRTDRGESDDGFFFSSHAMQHVVCAVVS